MDNPKICVVVVSHNGGHKVRACIDSIINKPAGIGFDLFVVDSASTNPNDVEYIKSLLSLGKRYRKVMISRKEISGFDVGGQWLAWKHTYENSEYDYYLVLQDDCIIMEDNWLFNIWKMQQEKFPDNKGVIALGKILQNWSPQHRETIKRWMGEYPCPETFYPWGSVYFAPSQFWKDMLDNGYMRDELEPRSKHECEAWEVTHGMVMKKLGYGIEALMGHIPGAIHPDHYKEGFIIKHDITLNRL